MQKIAQILRGATVGLCLAVAALAPAQQEVTLGDLMRGEKVAPRQSLDAIQKDYKPFTIAVQGSMASGMDSLFGGIMGPFMALMGGMAGGGQGMEVFQVMGAFFTKGEEVKMYGHTYLVGYRLDFSPLMQPGTATEPIPASAPADAEPPATPVAYRRPQAATPEIQFRLDLIRVDAIVSISPMQVDLGKLKDSMSSLQSGAGNPGSATEALPDDPESSSAQTQGLNNLKQIAIATVMYTADYDDVLPGAQSTPTARALISPYLRSVDAFKTMNPLGSEFRYNTFQAAVNTTVIEEPVGTPIWFESRPWPDGRRMVAYIDGSCGFVTAEMWGPIEAEMKRRYPRSGALLPANYLLDQDPLRRQDQ